MMQQMQAQQRGLDPRMAAGDPRMAAVDPRMAAVDPRMAAADPRMAAADPRMAAGMSADPRMAMMQQAMQLSPHDLAQLPPERRQKMEAMRAQYAAQYGGAPGYH